MSKQRFIKSATFAAGSVALAALTGVALASVNQNPFGMRQIERGQQVAAGEAECGANKKAMEEKAAEAKCGANKAAQSQGKHDAKMTGDKKVIREASCGEAKCGANK
jgi:uncharacterized low-complexity protein